MRSLPRPKFVVLDNFLPDPFLAELEVFARARPDRLVQMDLGGRPGEGQYSAARRLQQLEGGLGPMAEPFAARILEAAPALFAAVGVAPFPVARVETKVCVQQNGSYFSKHIDTDTDELGDVRASDRMVSAVYYFPQEPLPFEGGELILFDFAGQEEIARIAPRRNRLVAFPSFACHEVAAIRSNLDDLESARWSISCWLHRDRPRGDPHG